MANTNNMNDIITDIEHREGDGKVTNDPVDGGGRTQYGISEKSNPEAWADGKVTEAEARAIYQKKYVETPGFDKIPDGLLRTQLVDYGVNSGPGIAIQKLQEILTVGVDGVLGKATLDALTLRDMNEVNNLLVASRVKMIGRIVTNRPDQLKYLNGWLSRALEFVK